MGAYGQTYCPRTGSLCFFFCFGHRASVRSSESAHRAGARTGFTGCPESGPANHGTVRTPVAHRRNRNGTAHPTAVSLPRAHWRWVASRLSAVGQRHVPVHYYDGRVTNNQSFSARRSAGRTASRPVFISCRPDAELVTDEYNRGRPCASGA